MRRSYMVAGASVRRSMDLFSNFFDAKATCRCPLSMDISKSWSNGLSGDVFALFRGSVCWNIWSERPCVKPPGRPQVHLA